MAKPNWSRYKFKPRDVARMSVSQARRHYQYLYGIINKRAARLAKHGYQGYEYGKGIAKSRDIADSDIKAALLSASKRASDPETLVGGFKEGLKKQLEAIAAAGYKHINVSNFQAFKAYMDSLEPMFEKGIYNSHDIADLVSSGIGAGLKVSEIEKGFESYLDDHRKLDSAIRELDKAAESREKVTAAMIRKRVERR